MTRSYALLIDPYGDEMVVDLGLIWAVTIDDPADRTVLTLHLPSGAHHQIRYEPGVAGFWRAYLGGDALRQDVAEEEPSQELGALQQRLLQLLGENPRSSLQQISTLARAGNGNTLKALKRLQQKGFAVCDTNVAPALWEVISG